MEKPVAVLTPNFEIAANRHDQFRLLLPEKAMRHILTFFYLASLALPLPAAAAEAKMPNRMTIVVSLLDEDDIACGLDEAGIEAAAEAAMRYNRIEIAPASDAESSILGIRTATMELSDVCVTHIDLRTWHSGFAYFEHNGGMTDGLVALSAYDTIITTPKRGGEHTERINTNIKSGLDLVFSGYFSHTLSTEE